MSMDRKECTFIWFLENYSYRCHKNGEKLVSPEFIAEGFAGTVWTLQLYPRGQKDEYKGNISLFLNRRKVDGGPQELSLKFEISVHAADGSTLHSNFGNCTFKKGGGFGWPQFLQMNEVLLTGKADYLPRDTLSVRCKIWKGEGKIRPLVEIYARTRIGTEQISFFHEVENFCTLEPNQKNVVQIISPSNREFVLSSSLYFSEDLYCEEKIMVEIAPCSINQILSQCNFFLLDNSRAVIECGEADNRFDVIRRDIQKLPLTHTRQAIMNRKSELLPNDKLSLLCKCTFSTGVVYEKIENTEPFVDLNQVIKNNSNKDIYNATEKLSSCPSALDDFKGIYNDQFLTDVELKTTTKTFRAHKNILCARSHVFKVMMTNDMKEKNTNCIEVDDLENDTVQQFLLFLYSDQLENLEWESAIKLYNAADKYTIEKLKVMCASFLVDNLKASTASEVLLLADTHNDSDLKKAVEDFIFKYEEQVFGSDEWGNLMETNPLLVSKTMRLKYMKKILDIKRLKMNC